MNRLWFAFNPAQADGASSMRAFFLGQSLALLTAVAALGARQLFGPLFSHSVYLFCLPALLICAGWSGRASGLSVTLILAAGAFVADAYAGLPEPERIGRVAVFLLLGAAVAYVAGRLRLAFVDQIHRLSLQQEREAILRASLDAVADASVVIDAEGVIVSFSHAAELLFGWTAGDIIGQDVRVLMPLTDADGHDRHVQRYLQTGERRASSSAPPAARRRPGRPGKPRPRAHTARGPGRG